jgi:protein required for attachment to host cells
MKTWILSCDAGSARILSPSAHEQAPWRLLQTIDNAAGRAHVRDLVSDHAGRVRQSGTGAEPSMEAHTDPAEREKDRFARRLVEELHRAHHEGEFDRLVLVAPARFLGKLRGLLRPSVRNAVAASLDHDYEPLSAKELEARLRPVLASSGPTKGSTGK